MTLISQEGWIKEPQVRMLVSSEAMNYPGHYYFLIVKIRKEDNRKHPRAWVPLSRPSLPWVTLYFYFSLHSTFSDSLHLQPCICLVPISSTLRQPLLLGPIQKVQTKHEQASVCILLHQHPIPSAATMLFPSVPYFFLLPPTLGISRQDSSRGCSPFPSGYGYLPTVLYAPTVARGGWSGSVIVRRHW